MTDLLNGLYNWLTFLPRMTLANLIEIVILSVLIYEILLWIKNTRAWTLLRGLVVILGFAILAELFKLTIILWILEKSLTIAVTALIIIFQPELRKALEQLGSQNLLSNILSIDDKKSQSGFTDKTINELVKATFEMAKVKTGALIVISRDLPLKEIERTGIEVDGIVTSQLLINIFEHNTPLHDGAVVVQGNRVTAATCYLPLSDNMNISKELGTRHRAAVGISEVTDTMTIVVSEETGRVSVARGGKLEKIGNADELRSTLRALQGEDKEAAVNRIKIWKGRLKNERTIKE
ncbi:MAG: TIGR00159 family protein [Lachnospiraceae bacterium]|jgi:diadenylate cyclase|nr:TIGR00159 family protein [Lachnospiraceae bacterium]